MANFKETEERIGSLNVGEILGQGQFATVKSCRRDGSTQELAVKIMKKDRFTTFTALKRISNEIEILKKLKSEFIVSVKEVIQTTENLYIVTEKGGKDLFDAFGDGMDGLPESWVKEIAICILKAVLYCHDRGICHRDLKPENILLNFDREQGKVIDLKLCDFGLSSKFDADSQLNLFCGSAGFFAPEMIIAGEYDGGKVDVWSIGCILLELLFGYRRFTDEWMVAYDYEVLQSKDLFTEEIFKMVETLPTLLTFDAALNDFISQLLILSSIDRPNIRTICMHPWLEGSFDALLVPKPQPKATKPKAKRRPSITDRVSHSDSALISMPVRVKVQPRDDAPILNEGSRVSTANNSRRASFSKGRFLDQVGASLMSLNTNQSGPLPSLKTRNSSKGRHLMSDGTAPPRGSMVDKVVPVPRGSMVSNSPMRGSMVLDKIMTSRKYPDDTGVERTNSIMSTLLTSLTGKPMNRSVMQKDNDDDNNGLSSKLARSDKRSEKAKRNDLPLDGLSKKVVGDNGTRKSFEKKIIGDSGKEEKLGMRKSFEKRTLELMKMTPLHDALSKLTSQTTALRRKSQPLLVALNGTEEVKVELDVFRSADKHRNSSSISAENYSSSTVRNSFVENGPMSPFRNSFVQDAFESNTDDTMDEALYYSPFLPTAISANNVIHNLERGSTSPSPPEHQPKIGLFERNPSSSGVSFFNYGNKQFSFARGTNSSGTGTNSGGNTPTFKGEKIGATTPIRTPGGTPSPAITPSPGTSGIYNSPGISRISPSPSITGLNYSPGSARISPCPSTSSPGTLELIVPLVH
eukprot:CAMPEP_0119038458 /NCGR_PEP_ID=MMETSP1177-20130426/7418_1 /TAXON_ID=2985 /ORGANISM="Ochromonas sp, Strain CCMP1899" /LENGTH=804 /DNA_ID=CAMNT_0007001095 /DNA_START=485 /DNA_END=2900 /DNA_ORIENTATION=+